MTVAIEKQTNLHTQRAHKQAEGAKAAPKPLATIQCWAVVEAVVSQRFAVLQVGIACEDMFLVWSMCHI